jgi:hypothetical protein
MKLRWQLTTFTFEGTQEEFAWLVANSARIRKRLNG